MPGPEPDAEPRSPTKPALDAAILRRARELLADETVWDNDARTTLSEVHAALDEALSAIPGAPQ